MITTRERALSAALLSLFGFQISCSGDGPSSEQTKAEATSAALEASTAANAAADEQITIHFSLPGTTKLTNTVVSAGKHLRVGHRTQINGALASSGKVAVDEHARVGAITAGDDVYVQHHAHVDGDIVTAGQAHVSKHADTGKITNNASLGSPTDFQWTVTKPGTNAGCVEVEHRQSRVLDPGAYGNLKVEEGGQVVLRAGNYFFGDVFFHHHSKMVVDHRSGPVFVYVSGGFTYHGSVQATDSAALQLMVIGLGSEPIRLSAPFDGVIVAPQAKIELGGRPHRNEEQQHGYRCPQPDETSHVQIIGQSVEVEGGTIVKPATFDWQQIVKVPGTNETGEVVKWPTPGIEVIVKAPGNSTTPVTTSSSSPKPVCFTLSSWFSASRGAIANGTFSLGFVDSHGEQQSCLYRGMSSTAAPTSAADLRLSREFRLVSCTSGNVAGDQICTTSTTGVLTPSGGPYPVEVNLPLDDAACAGRFEFLSPSETESMLNSFDWSKAKPVDPGPANRPAIYYASLFIRNKGELKALKELSIHRLRRPLLSSELATFAGRCGTFTYTGTGEGFFVPVLIPGITYNKLIEAFSSPDVDPNQREVFKAVLIREVPSEIREKNGAVKYEALGAAHIQWNDDAVSSVETVDLPGGDVVHVFTSALRWVSSAVRDVGQVVTDTLAYLQKIFTGSVDIEISARALNHEDRFGADRPMVRAWGADGGSEIGVPGMHVTVLQNLFGTFIPTTATGNTNSGGLVHLNVPKVGSGGVRGSGVCLRMESQASEITGLLTSDDVCDFRGFEVKKEDAGNTPPPKVISDYTIHDFEKDRVGKDGIMLYIDNHEVRAFFQADDSYRYNRRVLGFDHKPARVLYGYWANTLSKEGGRAYVPCMTLGSTMGELINDSVLATFLGVPLAGPIVVALTGALTDNDIILPEASMTDAFKAPRFVMSHEYGHYTFCTMLAQSNSGGSVDGLIWKSVFGPDDSPNRYINEAFAEFLTGQVASAADYRWLPAAGSNDVSVCVRTQGDFPCFDENLKGNGDQGGNIGRLATMLHDVFDGQAVHHADVPGDADAWVYEGDKLTYSSESWGSTDKLLEDVALPGAALFGFVHHFGENVHWLSIDTNMDDGNWVASLNRLMGENGVNWCRRCLLFALHSTVATSPGTGLQERFRICHSDPLLSSTMGTPPGGYLPNGNLNVDAASCQPCASGYYSDDNGACITDGGY